jgi:uncharacterized membrane protein YsdA (DUF1294 family)
MTLPANRPTQELVDIVGALVGHWTGYIAMCRCPVHKTPNQAFRFGKGTKPFW